MALKGEFDNLSHVTITHSLSHTYVLKFRKKRALHGRAHYFSVN
jgi:hypothetical protein